jgi:competence protein ComFC
MISYASTTLHKKKYPIYSLGKYDGILRFITTEKYKRQILSLHGIQAKIKQLFLLYNIEFDTVIYIPKKVFNAISHRYNPSYEIALFLARHYQKEIFDELFYRYHGTSQSGKTTKDRLLLDTNQFIIPFSSYKKLKNKNVLIIDDVYTTGSTIDAIIKNIEKCEVKSISIFVIAKN